MYKITEFIYLMPRLRLLDSVQINSNPQCHSNTSCDGNKSIWLSVCGSSCGMCVSSWDPIPQHLKHKDVSLSPSLIINSCGLFLPYIWTENTRPASHIKHTHTHTRGLVIQKMSFACEVYLFFIVLLPLFRLQPLSFAVVWVCSMK